MIKFFNGDLLKSGCDIICHQVNEYGVMGAGIAKQIKEKYPKAFDDYTNAIKEAASKCKDLPFIALSKQPDGVIVANMFTQRNGKTDIEILRNAVFLLAMQIYDLFIIKLKFNEMTGIFFDRPFRVGIPYKYGCGIAKGDWESVLKIWEDVFGGLEYIDLEVWKYSPKIK